MPTKEIMVFVCLDCDGRLYLENNVPWHGKCSHCGGISGVVLEEVVYEEDVVRKDLTCLMCGDSFNEGDLVRRGGVLVCPSCFGGAI